MRKRKDKEVKEIDGRDNVGENLKKNGKKEKKKKKRKEKKREKKNEYFGGERIEMNEVRMKEK